MKRNNIGELTLTFFLCCVIAALIAFSDEARRGAKSGIGICEGVIIPSLLPILIICKLIISSRLSRTFEAIFGKLSERVFSLPRESAAAIILGLISGYPSGALLTCSLYERGIIGEEEAGRIMSFNVCGGAAFIITAVGTVTYGNTKCGAVLFVCSILSSLTLALISKFIYKPQAESIYKEKTYISLDTAFCKSVEDTVKALAAMCAYIILFSVICAIINPPDFLVPFLEITNGICEVTPSPAFSAFFLPFGGLCVHLQLLPFLNKMKVKYTHFFTGRMSCAVLSFGYYKLYSLIFSESEAVFSNISSPAHSFSSGGIGLSLIMIIGCAAVVLDLENRKIKLHS